MTTDMNLIEEVNFIKQDINFAVHHFELSEKYPEISGRIYINIQTKENDKFCVELSKDGFKVSIQNLQPWMLQLTLFSFWEVNS